MKHVCNTKICKTQSACRAFSFSYVLLHKIDFSGFVFLHCLMVEAVTLRNTKGLSCEEVNEITSHEKIVQTAKHVQVILMHVLFSRETAMKRACGCFASRL